MLDGKGRSARFETDHGFYLVRLVDRQEAAAGTRGARRRHPPAAAARQAPGDGRPALSAALLRRRGEGGRTYPHHDRVTAAAEGGATRCRPDRSQERGRHEAPGSEQGRAAEDPRSGRGGGATDGPRVGAPGGDRVRGRSAQRQRAGGSCSRASNCNPVGTRSVSRCSRTDSNRGRCGTGGEAGPGIPDEDCNHSCRTRARSCSTFPGGSGLPACPPRALPDQPVHIPANRPFLIKLGGRRLT